MSNSADCTEYKTLIICLPDSNFPLPLPLLNFKTMFAVVKIAGQQYKVEKDQTLYVPHLKAIPVIKLNLRSIDG